jgi:hypothetical protein
MPRKKAQWNVPVTTARIHHRCGHCGADLPPPGRRVPAADDAVAWEAVATHHRAHCRWVRTRGLRRKDDADG